VAAQIRSKKMKPNQDRPRGQLRFDSLPESLPSLIPAAPGKPDSGTLNWLGSPNRPVQTIRRFILLTFLEFITKAKPTTLNNSRKKITGFVALSLSGYLRFSKTRCRVLKMFKSFCHMVFVRFIH